MAIDSTTFDTPLLKVYLESSFVSYLTGRSTADATVAANQAYTRQWWRDERPKKQQTPVDEVRAVRHRIAEECGHDIRKIMEHAANAIRAMKLVATPSFA